MQQHHTFLDLALRLLLGDLVTVMKTKKNAVWTNQKSFLFLERVVKYNGKIMATTKNFITFSRLIVLFSLHFWFKNSKQFGDSSNYSQLNGVATATNRSILLVLASVDLRKKHIGP